MLWKLEATTAALTEEQKLLGNKFQALEDEVKVFAADQEEQAGKIPIPKDLSVSEHETIQNLLLSAIYNSHSI